MTGRRWSDGLHQAVEAKEGVQIQNENQTLASVTFQNYFRMYGKLSRHDRHGRHRSLRVPGDLRSGDGGHPAEPADDPQGRERPDLQDGEGEVRRRHRRHPRLPPARPAGAGGHHLDRELGADLRAAGQGRAAAPGAQCQAACQGGRDRGPGRPAGRDHHRHQHGRPRHRHRARRQRREAGADGRGRRGRGRGREGAPHPAAEGRMAGPARPGQGQRRAAHHRHRAPREPAHRQPAARPLRPPGRPGREPLLPVAGRFADAHLRRRPRARDHGPAEDARGRGHRGRHRQPQHRRRAAQGRGAQLRHPQAAARIRRRQQRPAQGHLPAAQRDPRSRLAGRADRQPAAQRDDRRGAHLRARGAASRSSGTSPGWRRC